MQPNELVSSLGCAGLVCFVAACGSLDQSASSEPLAGQAQPITGVCPNGNGLFVLYYGDATVSSEMPALRAARPNIVVAANDNPAAPDHFHFDNPAARTGPTGIKVLAYIPMNYARQNECADPSVINSSCSNLSCNGCSNCVPIRDRISTALAAGYDGVFFDEARHEPAYASYNSACYAAVKQGNPNRLVILNPGVASPDPTIFDAADIVSVENQYIAAVSSYGLPSWRWLAVQGDPGSDPEPHELPPQSLGETQTRFDTFRENGGFWYYSAEPHWQLEPWFTDFATWAKQQGAAPCPASFNVTVHALALDGGNAELDPGMCVFVDGDTSQCAGFTPYTATLTAGTHQLNLTDFPPNLFQHWEDGSTQKARVINVSGDASYSGYYTTQ